MSRMFGKIIEREAPTSYGIREMRDCVLFLAMAEYDVRIADD